MYYLLFFNWLIRESFYVHLHWREKRPWKINFALNHILTFSQNYVFLLFFSFAFRMFWIWEQTNGMSYINLGTLEQVIYRRFTPYIYIDAFIPFQFIRRWHSCFSFFVSFFLHFLHSKENCRQESERKSEWFCVAYEQLSRTCQSFVINHIQRNFDLHQTGWTWMWIAIKICSWKFAETSIVNLSREFPEQNKIKISRFLRPDLQSIGSLCASTLWMTSTNAPKRWEN